MRKWILALALAALAVPGLAEEKSTVTAYNTDLNVLLSPGVTTAPELAYCRTIGAGNDPWGADFQVLGSFDLQGNTLTDVGATGAFSQFLPGDIITLRAQDRTGGTTATTDFTTTVLAYTDANNVDVGPGVVAADAQWAKLYYRILQCSDGIEMRQFPSATPGEVAVETGGAWVNVLNWESVLFSVEYYSGDAVVGFAFECRVRPQSGVIPAYEEQPWGVQVYPGVSSTCGFGSLSTDICVFSGPTASAPPGRATGSKFSYQMSHTQNFYECRIGVTCDDVDCGTSMLTRTSITVNRQEVK